MTQKDLCVHIYHIKRHVLGTVIETHNTNFCDLWHWWYLTGRGDSVNNVHPET